MLAGCAAAGPAIDPAAAWRNPGAGETDPRRFALAHAILAPNPHNRQPWRVALSGDDSLTLWADLERLLPATDPPDRQIVLGCGAFLELLDLAAREIGRRCLVTPWPEGEPQPRLDGRPVAHVRLIADPAVARDPLFVQIVARRTNRSPYDLDRPMPAADLAAVAEAGTAAGVSAGIDTEPDRVSRLVDLGWKGWVVEDQTPATHMESARLMRIGAQEIARHRDGIVLEGPAVEAMKTLGLITPQTLADPTSFASRQGADLWRKKIQATPAFFWLKSADNSRATQLLAGRAYARAQLRATERRLSMQPWSMTLQEFPQMADLYRATQAELGAAPEAPVQMLTRIGYARPVAPAPRRGLADHLRP
jgi:hypothetical protein